MRQDRATDFIGQPCPIENLSHREMEVLRYLPTVQTAGKIAAEMHVSANTVKAHLQPIDRKLGVTRRHDAVLRAYEHDLLS